MAFKLVKFFSTKFFKSKIEIEIGFSEQECLMSFYVIDEGTNKLI